MTSSEYLLTRIAAGDSAAVAQCMDKYGGLVWSLARSRLGNTADAEDATQEIFIEIWKSAGRFNPELGSETAFVAMIARRRLIDRVRSISRQPDVEEFDETTATQEHPDEGQIAADIQVATRALEQLGDGQRELIMMGVVEGMTHSEIATATGKPLGTVKTQLRRGLAKVREQMERDSTERKSRQEHE